MSYARQLETKTAAIRTRLDGIRRSRRGPVAGRSASQPSLFLPIASTGDVPARFRQKASFVFGTAPGGRGLVMGHHERGSQRVVPVTECAVHSDRANRIAFALRNRLAAAGIPAAGPSLAGVLRHLIIRTTSDDREAIAMLVVTRNDKALRKPVRSLLESTDRPDGFFININTDPGPFMVGDETIKIDGRSHVREVVGGITYLISPTAFFQTNVKAAAVLQDYVVKSVTKAGRVLDLYCGSGLFALPLAAAGARVTGVEENRQAIEDARANARQNRISNSQVRFLASRVEDAVRSLAVDPWDAVILDPPRQGCSDEVLEAVFQEMRPAHVIYVSCNPEALAAELPGIVQCGYQIDDVRAVDMFPHTEHVEAIVSLRRE